VNTVTRTASGGYLYACLLSWLVWGHL